MSATSPTFRGSSDTDDVVGTARSHATLPRHSPLHRLVATDDGAAPAIARLVLGLVLFPHAAQKVFGWFGGYGFAGTQSFFTSELGIPGWLAATAIVVELAASVLLIVGALTRIAAVGVMAMMAGAIFFVHAKNGFWMNWSHNQAGEGFEYHLLAIGLALVALILGGGMVSVDRALSMRRAAEGGSHPDPVTRD